VYYINNKDNTDPWLNLALEEFAVRNLDKKRDYILLYVNQPSLIIGKHQNVLEEVDIKTAGELNIPIIRRISGGGTVYHDTGNLNISMITEHTIKNFNKYYDFLQPVVKVLEDLALSVQINKRNNLILKNKKISGNAQFTSRQRLLSHGTLLFNTNLDVMNRLIKPENDKNIDSRSTKSIRSAVTNISDCLRIKYTVSDLKQHILDTIFYNGIKQYELTHDEWQCVEELSRTRYKSWQWNYGLSPDCTITKEIETGFGQASVELFIEDGLIKNMRIKNSNSHPELINKLCKYFINKPVDYESVKSIIANIRRNKALKPLNRIDWMDIIYN
jgi:lipoate-protein ligase A